MLKTGQKPAFFAAIRAGSGPAARSIRIAGNT
jgi:hypothetical protein